MDLLSDVINYVRRIVKTASNDSLSDNLIIDYINRFWIMDVDPRVQLFDLKTKYQFQTIPQICDYNMPLYANQTQPGAQVIAPYPVYQGITGTAYVNGIQVPTYVQQEAFWKIWPNYIQSLNPVAVASGTGPYTFTLPFFPAIPGHVDMTGIISTGSTLDPVFSNSIPTSGGSNLIPASSIYPGVYITYQNVNGGVTTITDSGIFLQSSTNGDLYGLLINYQSSGVNNSYPLGYSSLGGYSTSSNTVNYITGVVNVTLPTTPLAGSNIQAQCYFFQSGIPRAILFYNNVIKVRPPPNIPYLIELGAYLTPAAFLRTTQAIQFAYMSEYIARGAARKMLSDTGDWEQFVTYEPLFKEQEILVWKRSQRIFTSQRTGTIFSELQGNQSNLNSAGQGAT